MRMAELLTMVNLVTLDHVARTISMSLKEQTITSSSSLYRINDQTLLALPDFQSKLENYLKMLTRYLKDDRKRRRTNVLLKADLQMEMMTILWILKSQK